MLVWVNGPFGVGKTQTAWELGRRVPGAVVCDPEAVGFGLHRMMPAWMREDFQDLAAWRSGVVEVLDLVLRRHEGLVVAPMTLVEPKYFDEIVGGLRALGHDVRHFSLLAERETIAGRLAERGLGHAFARVAGRSVALKRESFALSKLDLCLDRLREPGFGEHVWTDELSLREVVALIAASVGVEVLPDTDSVWRGRLRRAVVGVRHIRF
ncbi:AAA family ATPase [Actinokineospora diospyrosa]|uniref:AAA domain-containing protein n=1 Tax=Actinokineospora diospyrosa TaxID=103728 RepID=A0ABT1IEF1_9PSEU|nr:AAA family ATPase [Actinokineospora diospyrosa]MCP2271005.1 AAA domain-containing protein [Actinokineospora diospyrosa]